MRRPRKPILLLPAAFVLLVAVWVGLGSDPDLRIPPGPTTVPAQTAGEGGDFLHADAELAGAEAEPAAAESDARRQVAPTPLAEGTPGPVVLVVDGAARLMAGVDVWFLERETFRGRQRTGEARGLSEMDAPIELGASRRSDTTGRVTLPRGNDVLLVSAQHEDLFGVVFVRANTRAEFRLVLQRDRTLRVRVTDAEGRGAPGVPVGVYRGREWDQADDVWEGPTEGDGIAVIRHFQIHSERQRDEGDRFAAALALPLLQPAAVEFDGHSPPADPIDLVLPPTGALEARLVDGTGRELTCSARLRLVPVRQQDFSLPLPIEDHFELLEARKGLDREPFRFPAVGLGLDFVPYLRLDGDRRWQRVAPVPGPVRAGETAQVKVTLPGEFTVLAARLVDGAGWPLAGRQASYELRTADRTMSASDLRTDGAGAFELPLRLGTESGPYVLQLRMRTEDPGDVGTRVALGTLSLGQHNDAGDLVVGEVAAVATGRVVDDRGEPVAGADVRLQRFERRGDRESWNDTRLGRARTGEDGRFALPGPAPDGRLRVRARARDHMPAESMEIARGAKVSLELTRTGALTGSVLLPDWLPSRAVSVRLVSQEEPRRNTQNRLRRRDGPTPFEIDELPPGIYDATVELRNFPQPLERVAGIVIGPGANEDPRLQGLDLRSHVHRYRLRAVDASGRHLSDLDGPVLVRHARADGNVVNVGFRWQKGTAELLTASQSIEVTVFGVGYQPRTETLGPGDHAVYMHELQPARIHLPGARQLCGYGRKVRVSMIFTGDTGLPQSLSGVDQRSGERFSFPRWELSKSNGAWLGETDTVDVPLSRNGPHEVILRLYQEGVGGNLSVPVGTADVVVDGPEPVEHTLAVDAQKIAAAIAQLQARAAQQAERQLERQRQRGR